MAGVNPKYRQYVLGGIFAAMLLYYLGGLVFEQVVQGPLQATRQRTAQLRANIERRRKELQAAREAVQWLAYWQSQALPTNRELAQSLYQAWLVQLCDEAKLANRAITFGSPRSPGGAFQVLTFSLRARAGLKEIVDFLFGFYRTDLLHQIRTLTLTPLGDASEFDVTLTIEAAMLPDAYRNSADPEQVYREFSARTWRTSARVASARLEDYEEAIVGRNLFRVTALPDPLDYTFLTSITEVQGQREAWFFIRASDTLLRLKKGEILEVGHFRAHIREILESDVLIEAEEQVWLVSLGENLSQATALPPEF